MNEGPDGPAGSGTSPSGELAPQTVAGSADLPAELADYPVQAGVVRRETYQRWLPLVKWLLAFPHYVVLIVLAIGALFVMIAAFFAVLVTGRFPRGMWDYIVGVQRWGLRVAAYVYLMVDEYPPFSLADDDGYPARYVVSYPEDGVERWRPLVTWLLVFPYALVAGAIATVAGWVALIAAFMILFTERYPKGMFDIVEVALRWGVRSHAYANFQVTRYPPFAWG